MIFSYTFVVSQRWGGEKIGVMETIDSAPIDLMARAGEERNTEYREAFLMLKEKSRTLITDINEAHGLRTGDRILFYNGYGVEMITEILGFEEDGKAFLLWDCYWFAIDLHTRLIRKMDQVNTEIQN